VQCTNTAGSSVCGACPSGYTGPGTTCTDLNECATNNGGCAAAASGGRCDNSVGTYQCSCITGYTGSGFTCADVNECADGDNGGCGTPAAGECGNLPGSRTCTCNQGYATDSGGTGACVDENECATSDYCHGGACSNGDGTVTCDCQAGVTGTTCDTNGYVPPDKATATCEKAVIDNVTKYVKCVTKCRVQKAGAELAGKTFDEQACQASATGGKSCRAAYDKKMASLIAKGTCPACLDATAQGALADDALTGVIATKGNAYCAGTVPLAP
jgi:hypothetical protein